MEDPLLHRHPIVVINVHVLLTGEFLTLYRVAQMTLIMVKLLRVSILLRLRVHIERFVVRLLVKFA